MKKKWIYSLSLVSLLQLSAAAQTSWPSVQKEMKPWTRWWWPGSAVDQKNIFLELQRLQQVGFGGVEVTPIYGAKGFESRYVSFLSPSWLSLLRYTSQQADRLGMEVDLNLGTGWPFGGPQVSQHYAATKLLLEEWNLKHGETLALPLKSQDPKQTYTHALALRGYNSKGEQVNLDHLLKKEQGSWTAPSDLKVYAMLSGRTGQKVKRAAPGGEGFTLDHLGTASVQSYFKHFQQAFGTEATGVRAFFNDSYEVYGADWTDAFLADFERIKGYKLEDHLYAFSGKSDDKDAEARLKSDYREVVSEILEQHFLRPFTQFAHQMGSLSKNQAHGSPGNLLDLYGSTDIAECETFGSSAFDIPHLRRDSADVRNVDPDPMMFKFASSASHTQGKKLTSSETFTWLTEHFRTSLSQAKPEVEQLFLSGVNHVFYHGTTYSPEDVPFPGWLFYASVNFTHHNPFWSNLLGLNQYITRVQSILQSTQADNELLIYWPIYDIWHDQDKAFKQLSVHHVDHWLWPTAFYKQSMNLQRRGYGFDFISDQQLSRTTFDQGQLRTHAEAKPYQAIFIPETQYFSEETLAQLLSLAEQGATLLFQAVPQQVPGYHDVEKRQQKLQALWQKIGFDANEPNQYSRYGKGKVYLTQDIVSALETEKLFGEELSRTGLKFHRRIADGAHYYYLVNHQAKAVDTWVKLQAEGSSISLMDPQSGELKQLPIQDGRIRVQLEPGYAWILKVDQSTPALPAFRYLENEKVLPVFNQPWKLSFVKGGPKLPAGKTLKKLQYWTDFKESSYQNFSGTAAYETTFQLKKEQQKNYRLNLDGLGESAQIFVNGQDAGYIWAQPYQLDVAAFLKDGKNSIRIEVSNLMANRIRYMDQQKITWRNYHEINFVNINYEPFDAGKWAVMKSGLQGPIQLISY